MRHNLLSANRSGRRCKTCANTRPRDLMPAPAWSDSRCRFSIETFPDASIISGFVRGGPRKATRVQLSRIPSHRDLSALRRRCESTRISLIVTFTLLRSVNITFSSPTTGSTKANKKDYTREKYEYTSGKIIFEAIQK